MGYKVFDLPAIQPTHTQIPACKADALADLITRNLLLLLNPHTCYSWAQKSWCRKLLFTFSSAGVVYSSYSFMLANSR